MHKIKRIDVSEVLQNTKVVSSSRSHHMITQDLYSDYVTRTIRAKQTEERRL